MATSRVAAASSLQYQLLAGTTQDCKQRTAVSRIPMGLGSSGSLHRGVSRGLHAEGSQRFWAGVLRRSVAVRASSNQSISRPADKPRFIQHKQEAFWFYRFLSIVYDHVINPGHWTEDMREDALEPADLNDPNLTVVDVGGGTGFTTLGIVKTVDAKNVTILDQSPHQLSKAKEKAPLKDCKIIEGDAEDLPFKTDYADRYISAGRYDQFFLLKKMSGADNPLCIFIMLHIYMLPGCLESLVIIFEVSNQMSAYSFNLL
uniref:MPBQ/MBSQ family SAM-binding methyltransferase profile domain-containing protein n=1 Tax=Physcomitrium patens TaxID=3218 RepID=A0A7I3ZDU8_PHYPA